MQRILIGIKKVPQKWFGGLFWVFLISCVIVFGKGELLKKIEVGNVSAIYNTINNFIPDICNNKALKIILPTLAIICALCYVISKFYKERLILIKHLSLNFNIAEVDPKFLKQYYVKEFEISQCDLMSDPDNYEKAIEIQDNTVNEICKTRHSQKLGYYGIAHIPLIFRLGYKIGDENNVKLLHKKRNNESFFEELENTEDFSPLFKISEENKTKKSNELLISIATSRPINENELASLNKKDIHYLKFEIDSIGFDSVLSYKRAERLRNQIMDSVREACKKYGIIRIHLAIASSSVFIFFLAQAFSPQHDPEIIVYHFIRGEYPWGIIEHEKPENALVLNQNHKNS